jgi:transposase
LFPRARIEHWAMDEHRLGLLPILRRVWAPRGQPVVVPVNPRYQWLWVYGFVQPATGENWYLLLPTVSLAWFNLALAEFAAAHGVGARRRVLLTLDGAGFHNTEQIERPEGLDLLYLPPYSPELQPAERLWPLIDEAVANQVFADLDQFEAVVGQRCRTLGGQTELVRGLCDYHWWRDAALCANQ